MSKAAIWAAIAVLLAIFSMVVGQWAFALAMAPIGGLGYLLARSIEDVLERQQEGWTHSDRHIG